MAEKKEITKVDIPLKIGDSAVLKKRLRKQMSYCSAA